MCEEMTSINQPGLDHRLDHQEWNTTREPQMAQQDREYCRPQQHTRGCVVHCYPLKDHKIISGTKSQRLLSPMVHTRLADE